MTKNNTLGSSHTVRTGKGRWWKVLIHEPRENRRAVKLCTVRQERRSSRQNLSRESFLALTDVEG